MLDQTSPKRELFRAESQAAEIKYIANLFSWRFSALCAKKSSRTCVILTAGKAAMLSKIETSCCERENGDLPSQEDLIGGWPSGRPLCRLSQQCSGSKLGCKL